MPLVVPFPWSVIFVVKVVICFNYSIQGKLREKQNFQLMPVLIHSVCYKVSKMARQELTGGYLINCRFRNTIPRKYPARLAINNLT